METRFEADFALFQTIESPIGVACGIFSEYTQSVPSTFTFKGVMHKDNVL